MAKNLPYKVTQDELKEVFEDAVEIRLVSKDGKSKGYVLCLLKCFIKIKCTLIYRRNVDFNFPMFVILGKLFYNLSFLSVQ